ncbi:hypothetical protein ACOSQ4_000128 [Xanthoceras sorbifolium]
MDLINRLLNIIAPAVTLVTLPFFLPTYLLFKFLLSTIRTIPLEDVAGKVVLITGASSGIGKHLAYEYAMRGACLALVARREPQLREIATQAELLGSPNTIVIRGDVSKETVGILWIDFSFMLTVDHLVTNAGVATVCMFEDYYDITNATPSMDTNFWGSAYSTFFAIPHLKQSKGKIVAIASAAGWLSIPRMAFYNASKAAVIALYETLRIEFGEDIGVTIVTPGLTKSEMTDGKFLNKEGKLVVDQELRDVQISLTPVQSTEECAKAIVDSACRGERYLTTPSWIRMTYFWKVFWPEIIEWSSRFFLMTGPGTSQRDAPSKKILDLVKEIKDFLTPDTDQFHELKAHLDRQMYRRSIHLS